MSCFKEIILTILFMYAHVTYEFKFCNELLSLHKESSGSSITILLDWFVVEARQSMNIAAHDLWIQISAFTKQANVELVVESKENYVPL